MFTKLKKKIEEEVAISPRPGGAARISRSLSKESITSAGADSGDDFASDGSNSRDDLPSQIARRNNQIRRLETKLSATVRNFQDPNETHQAYQTKVVGEHVISLQKEDQVLNREALLSQEEEELKLLRTEVVASQAKFQDAQELSARLKEDLQKVREENDKLSQQRTGLTAAQEGAEKKITELEQRQQELQDFIQNLTLDLQKVGVEIEEKDILITQLKEKVNLLEKTLEMGFSGDKGLQKLLKEGEAFSRETVSVELTYALEETLKQKEDLQQQVADLHALIEENTKEILLKNEELIRKDEETVNLKRDYDALLLQMQQFHSDLEIYETRAAQSEESSARHASSFSGELQYQKAATKSQAQVSFLKEIVSAVHKPLHGTTNQESDGEVEVGDMPQLKRENQNLKQQIAEKNKTIKQLQQRMVELKKTLQKELKLKPEPEINDVREKLSPDPLATALTVTSTSDLTDSQEINLEYLKHVVLKFMSAREAEAFHLIKAISVLLSFSVEEENHLKETLVYKMSWFGSKPVPKGTVRPSISKPRTTWS